MVEENVTAPGSGNKDVEENKAMAAIAYLGILCLVPLLAKKDSPFAMYHAKQGLVLLISGFILYFAGLILTIITLGYGFWIPWIVLVLIVVLMILGIVNALNGKMQPLPIIGKWAEKWKI